MKYILVISVMLAGLTGCSGSSSDDKIVLIDETTMEMLNGTWLQDCKTDGATSSSTTLVLNNGDATSDTTLYSDTMCTTVSMVEATNNFTYTLGDLSTVDGTVDDIIIVREFNATGAGGSSFTVYKIESLIKLYFGDINADVAKDGSTADKRPDVLDPVPYIFDKK